MSRYSIPCRKKIIYRYPGICMFVNSIAIRYLQYSDALKIYRASQEVVCSEQNVRNSNIQSLSPRRSWWLSCCCPIVLNTQSTLHRSRMYSNIISTLQMSGLWYSIFECPTSTMLLTSGSCLELPKFDVIMIFCHVIKSIRYFVWPSCYNL